MSALDWLVLVTTIALIVCYGTYKTRKSQNLESFLLADKEMKWWSICLSIMGTQASAITFLSVPGQAYLDGMGFIQFYLGLPLAMVIISITAVPIYNKLKIYTAYEYLESRFDVRVRLVAAGLFLLQRGLSTGITIYAPAIILSTIMGWSLVLTNCIIGGLVIIYTVTGGSKAVGITQNYQMAVIFCGMLAAGIMTVVLLPPEVSFANAVSLAGHMGKLNLIDFRFNWHDRYNFWSGLLGGMFLALSYFGTDQSQVGRYLSGKSIKESRLGLLLNGVLKIPMQFLILLLGVLLFIFYQYHKPPLFFNPHELSKVENEKFTTQKKLLEEKQNRLFSAKQNAINQLHFSLENESSGEVNRNKEIVTKLTSEQNIVKSGVKELLRQADPKADTNDTDYIFVSFILKYLPNGLIGLLLAVIFCAAMSSTASGLSALASTTYIDIYKRLINKNDGGNYLNYLRAFTIFWGVVAVLFAILAAGMENLIQAVNILGSLFYGTILGIFLAAFYVKRIKSRAVLWGAVVAQALVLWCYNYTTIGFLWYNVIGCLAVVGFGLLFQAVLPKPGLKI